MKKWFMFALIAVCFVTGCSSETKTTDDKISEETEKLVNEAQRQVGLPKMSHFTEKRLAKQIMEKRDDSKLVTYTYIVDMNGKFHLLGQTVGYGLPYSTQYSNPEHVFLKYQHAERRTYVKVPQAEPNGLFMPTSSSATWVMMKTPDGGIEPQYIEPKITVFTFKLADNHPSVATNIPMYQRGNMGSSGAVGSSQK